MGGKYADPVSQIGQNKIVAELDHMVRGRRLHPLGARILVGARNWDGALIVLRWINGR